MALRAAAFNRKKVEEVEEPKAKLKVSEDEYDILKDEKGLLYLKIRR